MRVPNRFASDLRGRLSLCSDAYKLLLVDGNPLENIRLVADPGKNFMVIMKDGSVYKNTLPN